MCIRDRSQFLFIFFMLSKALGIELPGWVIACACIGAFFNPFAFMVRAIKPSYLKQPALPFTLMIVVSCILTTVGLCGDGGAACGCGNVAGVLAARLKYRDPARRRRDPG